MRLRQSPLRSAHSRDGSISSGPSHPRRRAFLIRVDVLVSSASTWLRAMPNFVRGLSVRDIRFPTKLSKHGSSAMVSDPDYSCAYVVLFTSRGSKGIGYCFTIGRGTEIGKFIFLSSRTTTTTPSFATSPLPKQKKKKNLVQAVKTLSHLVVGQDVDKILHDFATFWRKLTSDSQIRWLGPEKGVIHMAAGAIINALWDLWGKLENKPVWKLLADMSPEQLVSTIDFTYLYGSERGSDVLTKEEAQKMLEDMQEGKRQREKEVINMGYPTYTKSGGT
ncbi:unnamed protein product [Darwinula stevensoni]|uniref:Mandelate racemase/muconate lactonizing enzyme N-terminal domain-containing protein n=1 Tax=Darwinula stevensoni TaxID=69355 RepID=A0A7R9AG25_9CRUS|nr:unnamed protein product [Darwinula stevensoni]CAG0903497.1 unnamed protein product [Darwinula stevensoni]